MAIPNPVTNNNDAPRGSLNRRKKKKMQKQISVASMLFVGEGKENLNKAIAPWKLESRKEEYSSKLFQALRHVRLSSGAGMCLHSVPVRGRVVREAADRVLAMAAKGRSRWSRAILLNKLRKYKCVKRNLRQKGAKKPRIGMLKLKSKDFPAVKRKTRDLGRLVPGCRKQPFPVVLEEVADYIAALEMQVKAMAALANIFSIGSNSGATFGAGAGAGAVNLNQLSLSRRSPPSS